MGEKCMYCGEPKGSMHLIKCIYYPADKAIQEKSFQVASSLAKQKEEAVTRALNKHFGHTDWSEEDVIKIVKFMTYRDGGEVMKINGETVLVFGNIETDTIISCKSIHCLFKQSIEEF